MLSLVVLVCSSFCLAIAFTPLFRTIAVRCGLFDKPDGIRKLHDRPIPRIGGVPLLLAYALSFLVLAYAPTQGRDFLQPDLAIVRVVFPSAIIIFLTGLLDDLIGLRPWQKLGGQLTAAILMVSWGIHISIIGGRQVPPLFQVPVSIAWLIVCTNAFNLIDGVDGLAAGVGFLATIVTLIAALLTHNVALAIAVIPLAGALLGFLRFNFNPASIFLGDSGSLLVGFLLGCFAIIWGEKSATILGLTAPLIALSVPLLDTVLAVVRRFLRGQPIFTADHYHIHHKLLARGLTPRRVAIILYIVCGTCGALSLLLSFAQEHLTGPVIVVVCAGIWLGVHRLGYPEFEMARRVILNGNFRRQLNAELQLASFRDRLSQAETPDECWKILRQQYQSFGFSEIRFKIGEHLYSDGAAHHISTNVWTVRIGLRPDTYLNLSRELTTEPPPVVARFSDTICKVLSSKSFEHPQPAVHTDSLVGAAGGRKPSMDFTD